MDREEAKNEELSAAEKEVQPIMAMYHNDVDPVSCGSEDEDKCTTTSNKIERITTDEEQNKILSDIEKT